MFSLRMILISSLGLIVICLIGPTSGISIKTLTETTKLFFKKVKKVDSELYSPESLKEFGKIKYYTYWPWKIRTSEKNIQQFKTEFQKLITSTEKVAEDYMGQINTTISVKHKFGTEQKRDKLCKFYNEKIKPKFEIKGYGKDDVEVQKLLNKLTDNLDRVYNTIKNAEFGISVFKAIAAQKNDEVS